MVIAKEAKTFSEVLPGVERKVTVVGEKGLMAEFKMKAGALLPEHTHLHEQIGYLVSGEMVLTIDGYEHHIKPGDSWAVPGHAPHGVRVLENAHVVEVFIPIREDFLT